jgi:hypothetical protein
VLGILVAFSSDIDVDDRHHTFLRTAPNRSGAVLKKVRPRGPVWCGLGCGLFGPVQRPSPVISKPRSYSLKLVDSMNLVALTCMLLAGEDKLRICVPSISFSSNPRWSSRNRSRVSRIWEIFVSWGYIGGHRLGCCALSN